MSFELDDETLALPFPMFVDATIEWLEGFDWAIEDEPVFHFVRAVKGHRDVRKATVDQAYQALVKQARARRASLTVWDTDLDDEDGMVAFYSMWERVRFPMGTDPVQVACELAGTGLIRTQNVRPGRYERFLTAVALLQIQVRQKPVFLPVRKVGEHMPCEANTANSWINWAMADGVLIKTGEHAFRSGGESRAAEYVMGLHMWRDVVPKLSKLVGIAVRPQDLRWIEDQFAAARARST